jgi:hypothetical protein
MTQPASTWATWPAVAARLAWTDEAGNQNGLTFDLIVSEQWEEGATVTEHPVEQGADVADHVRVELRKCELKVWATNEPIDANNWDQATLTTSTLGTPAPNWQPGSSGVVVQTFDNPILLRSLAGSLVGLAGGLIGGAVGGAGTGQLAGDIAALVGLEAAFLAIPATAGTTEVLTDAGLEPPPATSQQVRTQQWPGGSTGTDYVAKTIAQLQLLKNTAQLLDVIGSKQFCSPMVIENITTVRAQEQGTGADITLALKEVRLVVTQTVPVPIPNLSGGGGVPPANKGAQDPQDAPVQTQKSTAKYIAAAISSLPPGGILSMLGVSP